VIAPPTFAIVMSMASAATANADPGLGLDYSMVVHGEQSFTQYSRPLHAGDVVVGDDHRRVDQGARRHVDADDVHRHLHRRRRARVHGQVHPRRTRGKLMTVSVLRRIEPGTELRARNLPVTRLDLVKYCGASGDFNVIHWNERVARAVGLPNVIAHGMYTMAQAGKFVTEWAGDPGAVTDFGVRFSAMVP
jgi:hypothetical protein